MDAILAQLVAPAVVGAVVSAVLFLVFRDFLGEGIRQAIRAEYDRKVEQYKRKLELRFEDQVKRRKMYEDLAMSLEELGSGELMDSRELSLKINKAFAVLALYAPDDVYRTFKKSLLTNATVYGKDAAPVIYAAMRKAIFGDETSLQASDLVDHRSWQHIPEKKTE